MNISYLIGIDEIRSLICNYLSYYKDVIALALSCKVNFKHIQNKFDFSFRLNFF